MPVDEPNNPTFSKPRDPTISEEDAKYIPAKYNFTIVHFDRPPFTGSIDQPVKFVNGRRKKNRWQHHDGESDQE